MQLYRLMITLLTELLFGAATFLLALPVGWSGLQVADMISYEVEVLLCL